MKVAKVKYERSEVIRGNRVKNSSIVTLEPGEKSVYGFDKARKIVGLKFGNVKDGSSMETLTAEEIENLF